MIGSWAATMPPPSRTWRLLAGRLRPQTPQKRRDKGRRSPGARVHGAGGVLVVGTGFLASPSAGDSVPIQRGWRRPRRLPERAGPRASDREACVLVFTQHTCGRVTRTCLLSVPGRPPPQRPRLVAAARAPRRSERRPRQDRERQQAPGAAGSLRKEARKPKNEDVERRVKDEEPPRAGVDHSDQAITTGGGG